MRTILIIVSFLVFSAGVSYIVYGLYLGICKGRFFE